MNEGIGVVLSWVENALETSTRSLSRLKNEYGAVRTACDVHVSAPSLCYSWAWQSLSTHIRFHRFKVGDFVVVVLPFHWCCSITPPLPSSQSCIPTLSLSSLS